MKIKLYWPQCNFLNGQWVKEEIDSYWVECTYEEAETYLFPLLTHEQIKRSKMDWQPREKEEDNKWFDTNRLCFLVSKNLESIMPMPCYYPYSGQWNAYCPFIRLKDVEVRELKELSSLTVEYVSGMK